MLEVLTPIAEEVERRLVLRHPVHTLHPAASHRCIFPQCAAERPVRAKEPGQQLLLLRPEENTVNGKQRGWVGVERLLCHPNFKNSTL